MGFTASDLPALRRRTAAWAERAGMSAAGSNDFVIAVNEIATNAVRHGSPQAWLRLWLTTGIASAEIRDTGHWPPGADVGGSRPRPREHGGMGLKVARAVCDDVQVWASAAGTAVVLRMAVK